MNHRSLRFHWSVSCVKFRRSQATVKMSGLPTLESQIELCRRAEDSGIESMLVAIGFTRPDPTLPPGSRPSESSSWSLAVPASYLPRALSSRSIRFQPS
jgi:hypothetical protein